jgi:hypothetical protein
MMFQLRIPLLTYVAKDVPAFDYMNSVRISFRSICLASPSILYSCRCFSIWLGISALGIAWLTRESAGALAQAAKRRRLALLHLALGSSFFVLAIFGFFIIPALLGLEIVVAAFVLLHTTMSATTRSIANRAVGVLFAAIVLYFGVFRPWGMRWGVTAEEARGPWPGEEQVDRPRTSCTMGITIKAPVSQVWPWLVQIGQERGGFYSYEWLENSFGFEIHNADRVVPEWQHLDVGDGIRLHHAGTPLRVSLVEPERAIVLVAGKKLGAEISSDPTFMRLQSYDAFQWAFYLKPQPDGTTRFIARIRTEWPLTMREMLHNWLFVEPVAFVMQRRMAIGLKARAERGQP